MTKHKVKTTDSYGEYVIIGEWTAYDRESIAVPLFGPLPPAGKVQKLNMETIRLVRQDFMMNGIRRYFWFCKPEDADKFKQEVEHRRNAQNELARR